MSSPSAMAPERTLGKAYDTRLMRRLWTFVRPHWKLLVAALSILPLTVGFEVAQPYLLKIAIDDHIATRHLPGLGNIVAIYLGLVVLQALGSYAQIYVLQLLGQRSMHDLRNTTYRHVIGQRAGFFDRMPVGRLLTRMTNDVANLNEMFSILVTLVHDMAKLVTIVVIMVVLNVKLTLMTFITLPLLFAVVEYSRRLMRHSFREIRVKLAAMNSYLQEHLSGLKVVQMFGREARASRHYDEINAAHRDAYLSAIRADASMYALVEAIGVISVATIAWFAGNRIGHGVLTVGLVVAFIEYINKFFIPVRDLSAKYTVMQSAMAATERIVGLLDTHEPDAPTRHEALAAVAPSGDKNAVELCDVHFAYRPGEQVLNGASLEVPRGSTVAVVGATGSGKSTIIKLIARLYEPQQGIIRVGGRDVRGVDAETLRRQITVVTQDVFLFAGTVADNVRLGTDGLSDAAIDDALDRVGMTEVLARRGETARAEVAEQGKNFSAGERQLIAFARALARDPEILVLDEATAHVDPEIEDKIERGLAALMTGRTTLVIAHRLSTIRHADSIAVMAHGRVAEHGSRQVLMDRGGLYARLERTFARAG
ncbi:MAG TPA: ABC transporter ATP-binding protein [Kofleriaceae bacterium]|nr:ABC transporter ATP-binding protein [Kofleriaceae bacterium]